MVINIFDYRLIILVLVGFVVIKLLEIHKKRKNFTKLRENRIYYSYILAKVLDDTNILNKASLSTKDADMILNTLNTLPEIDEIKALKSILKVYKAYVADHLSVHLEAKTMRKKIIIPIMRKVIGIFTIMDPELYELVEKEEAPYVKKKIKQKVYISSILDKVIRTSISRYEKTSSGS